MNKPNHVEPSVPPTERLPGRSFTDPSKPLGEDLIARGDPNGGDHGVPERAKVVAVLRKAEELMATGNPSGRTEDGRRRAIELACGRCGVLIHDYDHYLDVDEELRSLHDAVMESAANGQLVVS